MKCSNCGRENADYHSYCLSCGAPLKAAPRRRRRMRFLPRLVIQIIIMLIALGALVYWLQAVNLAGAYAREGGGYVAYAVFLGRERLYAPDEGEWGFSEAKVAETFPENTRNINARIDLFHFGIGEDSPLVRVAVEKVDDKPRKVEERYIELPRNGCLFDRDVILVEGRGLEAGRYAVRFYLPQDTEEPREVHFKTIHFSIAGSGE